MSSQDERQAERQTEEAAWIRSPANRTVSSRDERQTDRQTAKETDLSPANGIVSSQEGGWGVVVMNLSPVSPTGSSQEERENSINLIIYHPVNHAGYKHQIN